MMADLVIGGISLPVCGIIATFSIALNQLWGRLIGKLVILTAALLIECGVPLGDGNIPFCIRQVQWPFLRLLT